MKAVFTLVGAVSVIWGAAWGVDAIVNGTEHAAFPRGPNRPSTLGSTLELAWDNGTRMYHVAWGTLAQGRLVGNDFGTSTLKTSHVKILKLKFYTSDVWPNYGWEGFYLSVYAFRGGMPNEKLWPSSGRGYFFKPSGVHGHVWVECPINWICPTMAFVAAQEQWFFYPNCDPFCLDTNPTYKTHSWIYIFNNWSGMNLLVPYQNLMFRALVETGYEFPGVAPTSLGRVKALYY